MGAGLTEWHVAWGENQRSSGRIPPDSWEVPGQGGGSLCSCRLEEVGEATGGEGARQARAQAVLQGHWEPWKVLKQLVVAGVTLAAEGQVGSGMWGGIEKPLAAGGGDREKSWNVSGTPKAGWGAELLALGLGGKMLEVAPEC